MQIEGVHVDNECDVQGLGIEAMEQKNIIQNIIQKCHPALWLTGAQGSRN